MRQREHGRERRAAFQATQWSVALDRCSSWLGLVTRRWPEMRRILSLDFDGVLHPSQLHLPRPDVAPLPWLDHLAALLGPYPDVGLLVHSSWRETYTVDEIQDMLHPMELRFVGVAPRGDSGRRDRSLA